MKRFSLRYLLLTARFDQIWFPFALWAIFIFIGIMRGEAYIVDTSRAYLGGVVPLIACIMTAYAILQDPALELRFATPVPALQTLLERMVPAFVIQAFFALTYQLFASFYHADFSSIYGIWGNVQLAWLMPTLSLMTLGCFVALVTTQPTTGALIAGMVWLVELVARSWFAENSVGKYILVFMSSFMTDHPDLRANQFALTGLGIFFFIASWLLLRKQERYI